MILPILGSVHGLWGKGSSAGGLTMGQGFCITTNNKTFYTEGYGGKRKDIVPTHSGKPIYSLLLLHFALASLLGIVLLPLLFFMDGLRLWDYLMIPNSISGVIFFFFISARTSKEEKEYHACEHKVVTFLREYPIERVSEAEVVLPRCPKTLYGCGISDFSSLLFGLVVMGLVPQVAKITEANFVPTAVFYISVCLIASPLIKYALFSVAHRKFWGKVYSILKPPVRIIELSYKIIVVLPLLYEYFFYLSEPRPEIINEGLSLLKDIHDYQAKLQAKA